MKQPLEAIVKRFTDIVGAVETIPAQSQQFSLFAGKSEISSDVKVEPHGKRITLVLKPILVQIFQKWLRIAAMVINHQLELLDQQL